jgi:pimeloyl-ACP methyl ester carboxylesterase
MTHRRRIAFRIIGIIFGSIASLLAILALTNSIITSAERHHYTPPTGIVDVYGRKMLVHTEGMGSQNVVLLSGAGTPCPSTDFAPLIKALRSDFRVSVVEYFGYGWSDWTNKPRTNENVIEETRLALREAGILPPYILVPHSNSGIYVLYYANKHPEEISAIIGLDTSVPDLVKYFPAANITLIRFAGILRAMGIVRIALLVDPGLAGYDYPTAFSEIEMRTLLRMASWNFANRTIANEVRLQFENMREVQDYKYPNTIPISFVLSQASVQNMPKVAPGLDWIKTHQNLIVGNPKARMYFVEGSHYVHWQNAEKIAQIIRETVTEPSSPTGK